MSVSLDKLETEQRNIKSIALAIENAEKTLNNDGRTKYFLTRSILCVIVPSINSG